MSLRSIVLAAAAASAVVAGGAEAQSSLTNPSQLYSGFNISELSIVANELGYQATTETLSDGTVISRFESPDIIFFARRTVCNAETCSGLNIFAILTPGFDVPLTVINDFNARQPIVSAYKEDDSLILSRYLIADYGTPKGNVASNLHNFNVRAIEFAKLILGGANTISAKIEGVGAATPEASAEKVNATFVGDNAAHGEFADLPIKELVALGGAMTLKK